MLILPIKCSLVNPCFFWVKAKKERKKKEGCQRKNKTIRKISRNRIKKIRYIYFFCENRYILFGLRKILFGNMLKMAIKINYLNLFNKIKTLSV